MTYSERDIGALAGESGRQEGRAKVTVNESIVINRPRKEVWAYVLDPGNMTLWQTNVTEYDADWDEQPEVGDRIRAETNVAGAGSGGRPG